MQSETTDSQSLVGTRSTHPRQGSALNTHTAHFVKISTDSSLKAIDYNNVHYIASLKHVVRGASPLRRLIEFVVCSSSSLRSGRSAQKRCVPHRNAAAFRTETLETDGTSAQLGESNG